MDLTYWFLFPAAILIAAVANGAGVGGATFFSPLFILVLGLEPTVAIGTALATEVFGFSSGVLGHARARTIDWGMVKTLAVVSVPAAVAGSLVAGYAPDTALKFVLGIGLFGIASVFVRHHDPHAEDEAIALRVDVAEPSTHRMIVAADDRVYDYEVCRTGEGRTFAAIGGLLVGLISTGLGEANSYMLVKRCRVPSRVAVAISVTVVAMTALAASVTHFVDFVAADDAPLDQILSIISFTIPGVIIGGQLGPLVVARVPEQRLVRSLGWLFFVIAFVTLTEAVVG